MIVRLEFGLGIYYRFFSRDGLDALHRRYTPLTEIYLIRGCLCRLVVIVLRICASRQSRSRTRDFKNAMSMYSRAAMLSAAVEALNLKWPADSCLLSRNSPLASHQMDRMNFRRIFPCVAPFQPHLEISSEWAAKFCPCLEISLSVLKRSIRSWYAA